MPFPEPDVCVFCGWRGELTEEHAYPDWIRRRLNPQGPVEWRQEGKVLPGHDTFEITIKAVCGKCNSGWLDRYYEKKISKWIGPTLPDARRSFALDQHQREVTAAWAVKTALMIELAIGKMRGEGFAPESHFRWLHVHRTEPTPPPGCQVWMFGIHVGSGLMVKAQLAWAKGPVLKPTRADVPPAYFATFTAGYVGFQVFGPDLDEVDPKIRAPQLPVPLVAQSVLNPVWPAPRKPPLRWPPPQWIEPPSLEALALWPFAPLLRSP